MDFDIRADGMVVVSLLRRGRRPHNAWPAENRAGHEEAEMTDEQIEAACIAYVRKGPNFGTMHYPGDVSRKWYATSGYVGDTYALPKDTATRVREAVKAALEAAERVAPKDRWYSDEESSYESPDDAAECASLSLGESIALSENVTLSEDRWQVVPVTDRDALCPCGKPEGCGDFLGRECEADHGEIRRWSGLPKEWRR